MAGASVWTAALVAAGLGLVLVPSASRVARWAGFVAAPRIRVDRRIAYLGGPAVAIAIVAGAHTGQAPSAHVALVLALAAALGAVGLVDDHRPVPARVRFVVQVGAAVALVATGRVLTLTGAPTVDALLTVLFVVTVVNGVNFLDNSDALAACIVSVAACGLAFAGATDVAVPAAAIAGAAFAFLVFNLRPATIYLGDAGSMFLGFVLPALALEIVHESSSPASSSLALVALFALPGVELALTALRRVRHGRPFWYSAPDNLTYALVANGCSTAGAVVRQLGAQIVLTVAAVLALDGRAPIVVPVLAAAFVVAFFAVATRGAVVYPDAQPVSRRFVRPAIAAAACCAVVLVVVTAVLGKQAYEAAERGAAQVEIATAALRAGNTAAAAAAFATAEAELDRAHDRLSSPLFMLARHVPIAGQNLRVAAEVVAIARDLAREGALVADSVHPEQFGLQDAQIPVTEVQASQPALDRLAAAVADAQQRVAALDRDALLAPVTSRLRDVTEELDAAAVTTSNAADAARIVPGVFGADGTRRYLVVAQNNAEARATGGIVGSYGLLTAEDGRLDLGDFQPVESLNAVAQAAPRVALPGPPEYVARYGRFEPDQTWENMTMSPDFPTVGSVMAAVFEQQHGIRVDGVVSLDPFALRALLELTGPVTVDGWPEPVSADNVVAVALRDEYTVFTDNAERKQFLGRMTRTIWDAVQQADLHDAAHVARVLGPAVHERHLMVWLARPEEQAVVHRLGLAGNVPEPTGDAFFVTAQNGAGTKLDAYLQRALTYDVTVVPTDRNAVNVTGDATITLTNTAPAGLPTFVAGPLYDGYVEGQLRLFVSVYSGLDVLGVQRDGAPWALEGGREFGRRVSSAWLDIPRGERTQLSLALGGVVRLDDGWYRLHLLPQPGAIAERLTATIRVPDGVSIVDAVGCTVQPDGTCTTSGDLTSTGEIAVRIGGGRGI